MASVTKFDSRFCVFGLKCMLFKLWKDRCCIYGNAYCNVYVVCLKSSVNFTRKQTKQKMQTN
jgi:hypothetical protein